MCMKCRNELEMTSRLRLNLGEVSLNVHVLRSTTRRKKVKEYRIGKILLKYFASNVTRDGMKDGKVARTVVRMKC